MSDPDSVGEHSDKKVNQVTDPQGLPGDEAGGAEDVVERGQNVFYSVDSVPPIYLMVLFGLQVNFYIMFYITLCTILKNLNSWHQKKAFTKGQNINVSYTNFENK